MATEQEVLNAVNHRKGGGILMEASNPGQSTFRNVANAANSNGRNIAYFDVSRVVNQTMVADIARQMRQNHSRDIVAIYGIDSVNPDFRKKCIDGLMGANAFMTVIAKERSTRI